MLHHLQNGINRMLPFVVAGALFMALAGQLPSESSVAQSIAGWDGYLLAIAAGSAVTALVVTALKPVKEG